MALGSNEQVDAVRHGAGQDNAGGSLVFPDVERLMELKCESRNIIVPDLKKIWDTSRFSFRGRLVAVGR